MVKKKKILLKVLTPMPSSLLHEEGNRFYQEQNYAKAIESYTKALAEAQESDNPSIHLLYSNRSVCFLNLQQSEKALKDAQSCLRICQQQQIHFPKAYSRVGAAAESVKDYKLAVNTYKQALQMDPTNSTFQQALQNARTLRLNSMEDVVDEQHPQQLSRVEDRSDVTVFREASIESIADNSCSSIKNTDKTELESHFVRKVIELSNKISIEYLFRLIVRNTLHNLKDVAYVKATMVAFVVGVILQAIVHRSKLMMMSIVFICFWHSGKFKLVTEKWENWFENSVDRLGSLSFVPCAVYCIPIIFSVYGSIKMFLFVHNDILLSLLIFGLTLVVTLHTFSLPKNDRKHHWGRGKKLKLIAHGVIIVYWLVVRGRIDDTFQILAPAIIHAASVFISSIPSNDVNVAMKKSISSSIRSVVDDVKSEIGDDMWFLLGIVQWTIDYWQQPSNFSLAELEKLISSLQSKIVGSFNQEINHFRLRKKFSNLELSDDYKAWLHYVRETVDNIPPSKQTSFFVISLKRCPSCYAFCILLVFGGKFVFSLVPFVLAEWEDIELIYDLAVNPAYKNLDTLDLILLDSKLSLGWERLKTAIYCLECSSTVASAAKTGSKVVNVAQRIGRLATAANSMRHNGINADGLVEGVIDITKGIQESSIVVQGIQKICESSHVKDLWNSFGSWWYGKSHEKEE